MEIVQLSRNATGKSIAVDLVDVDFRLRSNDELSQNRGVAPRRLVLNSTGAATTCYAFSKRPVNTRASYGLTDFQRDRSFYAIGVRGNRWLYFHDLFVVHPAGAG
jgi:hypothetical protein